MNKLFLLFPLLGLLTTLVVGCGSGGVKEQDVEIKIQINPMDQAKHMLERYAKGEPLGSEAANFQDLITKVKSQDPAKGDILEKGLEELKKTPKGQLQGKAKDLMGKLGMK